MSQHTHPEVDQIREWIRVLDERDAQIQAELEPLAREQASNQERRRLLADLLVSYGNNGDDGEMARAADLVDATETIGERVRRHVRDVLGDADGQMHINEIHAEFLKRGFAVPGQGRPANITTHLTGSEDIVSPQRGYYGLSEVVGPVKRKPTPRRKTRKRGK
jgi:hypothetical protein